MTLRNSMVYLALNNRFAPYLLLGAINIIIAVAFILQSDQYACLGDCAGYAEAVTNLTHCFKTHGVCLPQAGIVHVTNKTTLLMAASIINILMIGSATSKSALIIYYFVSLACACFILQCILVRHLTMQWWKAAGLSFLIFLDPATTANSLNIGWSAPVAAFSLLFLWSVIKTTESSERPFWAAVTILSATVGFYTHIAIIPVLASGWLTMFMFKPQNRTWKRQCGFVLISVLLTIALIAGVELMSRLGGFSSILNDQLIAFDKNRLGNYETNELTKIIFYATIPLFYFFVEPHIFISLIVAGLFFFKNRQLFPRHIRIFFFAIAASGFFFIISPGQKLLRTFFPFHLGIFFLIATTFCVFINHSKTRFSVFIASVILGLFILNSWVGYSIPKHAYSFRRFLNMLYIKQAPEALYFLRNDIDVPEFHLNIPEAPALKPKILDQWDHTILGTMTQRTLLFTSSEIENPRLTSIGFFTKSYPFRDSIFRFQDEGEIQTTLESFLTHPWKSWLGNFTWQFVTHKFYVFTLRPPDHGTSIHE